MYLKRKFSSILLFIPMVLLVISNYNGFFPIAYIVQIVCIAVIFILIIFSKSQKYDDLTINKRKNMFYIAIVLTILVSLFSFLVNFYF